MADASIPSRATLDEIQEIPSLPELLTSNTSVPLETLSVPEISGYLTHLTTLPLETLQTEPTTLSSSSAQLTNALTTLCYTSYPTFLSLHSTASTLTSSLSSLSTSLDSLLSILPSLESSTQSFATQTRQIQKSRRKANLVLEHHDKLYDVLSLPLLLDSCIRNHNYGEALMLSNHSTHLSKQFPSNPLIQSVQAECDARVQVMLRQLLGTLTEQAKLPSLFKSISFLRKMVVMDEKELALAFLTGRGAYLEGVFKSVVDEKRGGLEGNRERDKEIYAKFLKKYVDAWREGIYDVVTQYMTIFLDRSPSTSSTSTSTPTSGPHSVTLEDVPQLHALLTTFTTYHLEELLSLLRETLPLIPDPSLLTSLLTQLTYCANSFARVGMDFKGLLAPIFIDAVKRGVKQELDDALVSWNSNFTPPAESSAYSKGSSRSHHTSIPKRPSQHLIAQSSASSPPKPTPTQLQSIVSSSPNVPPQILVSYPPLAVYTNAILTALNGLRMLAPVELLPDLLRILDHILSQGGTTLLNYAKDKPWRGGGTGGTKEDAEQRKESNVVSVLTEVYFEVFVPFVRRALAEGVYGVKTSELGDELGELEDVIAEWKEGEQAK